MDTYPFFRSHGLSSCMLEDHIEYSLPGGKLSEIIASPLIDKKLNQMFDYRHRLTREDLYTHAIVNKIRGNDFGCLPGKTTEMWIVYLSVKS
jgi:hypothetical protein